MADKQNPAAISFKVEDATKKKGKSSLEVGDSGTKIYQGLIYEEYNAKLRDVQGIAVYDEMRKSDGTVRAAVLACVLPVLRARWFIESAAEDGQPDEVSEFVSKALFEMQDVTWDYILRHALLSLPFGVMVFEKVFDVAPVNGTDRVIWKKLAPRMPLSIQAWQCEDGTFGIQQRTTSGKLVNIPGEKLLIVVNELEGENYWGNSILRAAYKHWHIKNTLYKIDAIGAERQGLGIPFANLPVGFTPTDQANAETVLKNMRANEQAFAVFPEGWEIGFLDMKSNTVRPLDPSISHHDRQITKSVLAQFLELGATSSGSRALSQDQSEIFLQSLEAVASTITDLFNKDAIKQLVDFNFPGIEAYPQLKCVGISRVDVKAIADTYAVLTGAGGISADPADEQHFRELLGLPERSEELVDEDQDHEEVAHEDAEDEALDEAGLGKDKEKIKKKEYPERKEIANAIKTASANLSVPHQIAFLKRSIGNFSQFPSTHPHASLFYAIRGELNNQLVAARKVALAEDGDFKSFRPLTLAEKKVDFDSIEKALDRIEEEFDIATQALLNAERTKFIEKLSKAASKGDKEAMKAATLAVTSAYAKIIKDSMKESYEYGKNNAALEIKKRAPANLKEVLDQIDVQATSIAEMHIAEITTAAKTGMLEALSKGESLAAALAVADAIVADKILKITRDTSRIVVAGYINQGRGTVFTTFDDDIYALQRSEILDRRTCNYCLSVDGRIIEKDDAFGQHRIFHSNCRGIWVGILLDESELPAIGGIPKSVRDRFGGSVNDLIQPREANAKKDSAARKEVERRLKRKANKK